MYLAYSKFCDAVVAESVNETKRCSVDFVREIPECLYTLMSSIKQSLSKHFHEWQRQPRCDLEWAEHDSEYAEAIVYDAFESEYWDDVSAEIDYLNTVWQYYARQKAPKRFSNSLPDQCNSKLAKH